MSKLLWSFSVKFDGQAWSLFVFFVSQILPWASFCVFPWNLMDSPDHCFVFLLRRFCTEQAFADFFLFWTDIWWTVLITLGFLWVPDSALSKLSWNFSQTFGGQFPPNSCLCGWRIQDMCAHVPGTSSYCFFCYLQPITARSQEPKVAG